jgi:hypothetical protein
LAAVSAYLSLGVFVCRHEYLAEDLLLAIPPLPQLLDAVDGLRDIAGNRLTLPLNLLLDRALARCCPAGLILCVQLRMHRPAVKLRLERFRRADLLQR